MSLRRRIAVAAALAVAAVAAAVAVTGYVSTRWHLVGQLQNQLRALAEPYLQPHPAGAAGGRGPQLGGGIRGTRGERQNGEPEGGLRTQPPPGFGAAPGYFQGVLPNGKTFRRQGETVALPVDARSIQIARAARGSSFTSATVRGHRLEILTVVDPFDHWAIQVALPLSGVDSVLNGLLLPYGLLIAGGILLAALLGLTISRAALQPIERFVRRTEDVTSTLERPRHLDETGPQELKRLAASFNQTLDALERSIDAQRNLVADASHELRTPIAALRSNIQIFLESGRLPAEERETLRDSILAELDELTQVVSNVVELARGASGSARRERLELDSLVEDAVERARRRAPAIAFTSELESTIVLGDPDRIGRAVTNVIDNARKWSAPGDAVEIKLEEGTLSVRDHGPGFDERDLPHVFDRFYRAAHARRLPGSGLGLAIVKQAAQEHGGTASASNAPGGGALVEVSFGPALERPRTPARGPAHAPGRAM